MRTGNIRRFAEVIFGPIVIKRRLAVNAGGSFIYASAQVGGLKYLFKSANEWDKELLRIAAKLVHRNDIVWDVGDNVGLFSRAAAFHAGSNGKVLSIEADLNAVALLLRTCRTDAPKHATMTVLPVAVSESIGLVRFAISKRARASNSIEGFGSSQTGGVGEVRILPSFTLDSILDHFQAPNILKIDVEGAEANVLGGSERLLRQIRPVIYIEVASSSAQRVTDILRQNSYRIWDGANFQSTSQKEITLCSENTVAVPADKAGDYI